MIIPPISVSFTRPANVTAYAAGDVIADSASAPTVPSITLAPWTPGADWSIYVASRRDLVREFVKRGGEGYIPGVTRQDGFTDRERKEIWIVGQPSDAPVLQRFAHEILEHGPDNAAARVWSPGFDVLYGDAAPETRAASRALQESQRAANRPE